MRKFKPMLAATAPKDLTSLDYPVLVSAKLDGIRAIVLNGEVVSRSLKPIPNLYVQEKFGRAEYEGFDGELILGDPTDHRCFNATTSVVMSHADVMGRHVTFHVFDDIYAGDDFYVRHKWLEHKLSTSAGKDVYLVHQSEALSATEVEEMYEWIAEQGYEGVMLRSPYGPYKCGRSTVKEGFLLKLKPFIDDEAVVIGVEQEMHNDNPATTNALGYTERSTAQSGLVGAGRVGAFVCRLLSDDAPEFKIGVFKGVTASEREQWWKDGPEKLIGKLVKFRSLPVGVKDKPRHPVFLGWRHEEDM